MKNHKNLNFYFSGGSAALDIEKIKAEISSINREIFKGYKLRIGKAEWNYDLKRIETARNNWDLSLMVDAIMGTIRPPMNIKDWQSKIND